MRADLAGALSSNRPDSPVPEGACTRMLDLPVLLDDGGGLVRVDGGGAAGGLGGGDAFAGVLADHVALELQDGDHHFGAGVVAGQVDPGQQSGFDAQVKAAADERGAQGEDVGDGAEQAGGVEDRGQLVGGAPSAVATASASRSDPAGCVPPA